MHRLHLYFNHKTTPVIAGAWRQCRSKLYSIRHLLSDNQNVKFNGSTKEIKITTNKENAVEIIKLNSKTKIVFRVYFEVTSNNIFDDSISTSPTISNPYLRIIKSYAQIANLQKIETVILNKKIALYPYP